jgi:hypothetical protein
MTKSYELVKAMMKKIAILTSAFLSVSAAQAETTIDNLVNASKTIAAKLEQGRHAVYGAEHYASVGGIIDYSAVDDEQYIINEGDITAYNEALAGVQNALYFTTKMALEEKYEESMVKVSEAVDNFIVASVQLSVVEEVADKAEVAQETNAVEDQLAVQEFVETNDVTLKQETVVEYNQSIEAIAVNARDAGAFLAASKNEQLTSLSDEHAQDYGNSMAEASISYSATNDILSVQWATNTGHIEFHDFLMGDYVTASEVLGQGEAIYSEQQAYMYQ